MARENDYLIGLTKKRRTKNTSSFLFHQALNAEGLTNSVFWNDWVFGVLSVKLNSGNLDSQTDIGSTARLVIDSSGVLRNRVPVSGDKTIKIINGQLIAI